MNACWKISRHLNFSWKMVTSLKCYFPMQNPIKNLFDTSIRFEPQHNKMTCVHSKDSDQPGHPPSLIKVFSMRSEGSQGNEASSGGQ